VQSRDRTNSIKCANGRRHGSVASVLSRPAYADEADAKNPGWGYFFISAGAPNQIAGASDAPFSAPSAIG